MQVLETGIAASGASSTVTGGAVALADRPTGTGTTPFGAVSFTDRLIGAGTTPVKAIHFRELRVQIAALRERAGLPAAAWTDPVLATGVTAVKRVHLTELRAALDEVYAAAGRPAPRYTDATVTAGVTPLKAAHIEELRTAVLALGASAATTAAVADPSPPVERVAATGAGRSEEPRGGVFAAVDPVTTDAAPLPQGTDGAGREPLALRRRLVAIDRGALARAALQLGESASDPPTLVLNLFDVVVVTGVVERREPTFSGGFALSGGIEGTEMGKMILVVNGPVVVGTIWTPDGTYWIEPGGGGVHVIGERNPAVTFGEPALPTVDRTP